MQRAHFNLFLDKNKPVHVEVTEEPDGILIRVGDFNVACLKNQGHLVVYGGLRGPAEIGLTVADDGAIEVERIA